MSSAPPAARAPREHGAWVMLAAPLIAGLAAGSPSIATVLLLPAAAVALFVGQEAWSRRPLTVRGLAPTLAAVVAGVALLLLESAWQVLPLAAPAAIIGALWLRMPSRRSARRERGGQLLAVALLCLGAPAGSALSRGRLDLTAGLLWLSCFLWFAGGVLYVGMLLAAPRSDAVLPRDERRRVGRDTVGFHLALALAAVALAAFGQPWLALGVLPAPLRALWRYRVLGPRLVLKRVGLWEAAYTVWFLAGLIAAARGW